MTKITKIIKNSILLFVLLFTFVASAQVGIGTTSPAVGSLLDLTSTNKGFLVPRVNIVNLNNINPVTGGATVGLLVWNTRAASGVGYHYWNGSRWVPLGSKGDDWSLTGNALAGGEVLGTTNTFDLNIITDGANRMKVFAAGQVSVNLPVLNFAGDIFSAEGAFAVNGYSTGGAGIGVYGEAAGAGRGVWGTSTDAEGVFGYSENDNGVDGYSFNWDGVHGDGARFGVYGESLTIGVWGEGPSVGVLGDDLGAGTVGTQGQSDDGFGVFGFTETSIGVYGQGTTTGTGVQGNAITSGDGVQGFSATGDGVYGQTTAGRGVYGVSTTGNGVLGNSDSSQGVFGISTSGIGVRGLSTGLHAFYGDTTNGLGLLAFSTNGDGMQTNSTNFTGAVGISGTQTATGVAGTSDGGGFYATLVGGSGVAGEGLTTGVYGVANTTTTAGFGGYFINDGAYAYVGGWQTGPWTMRKILGNGSVSTIVKDVNDNLITMTCPESPEILFQDYGIGELVNGSARINIDPNFSKNIRVDAEHPLKVFVQLEGDCNGVYVTNKSANGFDVKELQRGNANVSFSWSIVATRADDEIRLPDGRVKISNNGDRFQPAPAAMESKKTRIASKTTEDINTQEKTKVVPEKRFKVEQKEINEVNKRESERANLKKANIE